MADELSLSLVAIQKPDDVNVIVGQSHFIKTVEDLHEAMVNAVPGIKFGVAFCEASGHTLVRWSGTDGGMIQLAKQAAEALAAGHVFAIFLRDSFPINVLNAIKQVPEVCGIYCATANPLQVVIAETAQGRGVMGVIDGAAPKGVEDDAGQMWRRDLVRRFGYKA